MYSKVSSSPSTSLGTCRNGFLAGEDEIQCNEAPTEIKINKLIYVVRRTNNIWTVRITELEPRNG